MPSSNEPSRPAGAALRALSRAELLVRLQALEAELVDLRCRESGVQGGLLHELQVHQVELEMQNREMQETQAALEESRGRYAELYHHAPTGFVTLDRAGRVVEANATVGAMLNLKRARLVGTDFDVHVEPHCRPSFRQCVESCFLDVSEHSLEVMLHVHRGPKLAVQVCARRALGRWGPGKYVHVSLLNVNDRHELDGQLKFSLGLSDALLDTLDPDVLGTRVVQLAVPFLAEGVSFSAQAQPSRVELATAHPLGHRHRAALKDLSRALQDSATSRQLLAHRRALSIEVDDPAPTDLPLDATLLQQAKSLGLASILVLPACSRRKVLGAIILYHHRDAPRRRHLSAFFEDFAHRIGCALDNAQLYRRSCTESLARRNLLAVVSHDLRNPLSVVLLKGEQLMATSSGATPIQPAQVRRRADVVLRCAQRMNELIGDLLDATSIESGSFNVSVAPVALSPLIAEALEAAQAGLAGKKIMVNAVVEEDLQVMCDRRRTMQVLGNILSNAVKFTDRGGQVTLCVQRAGNFAVISVADTGVGMDEAACNRAFERFWQLSDTAHLGSGLGLSICKGIVEASGGKIWAQSVRGIGSTFSFTLPLVPLSLPAAPHEKRSAEVLFIGEPQGEIELVCTAALSAGGLNLTRANNIDQALGSLAHQTAPRAMVLELCAADTGVWDLLARREGEARLRAIPVVAIGRDQALAAHVEGTGTTFVHRADVERQLVAQVERACGDSAQTETLPGQGTLSSAEDSTVGSSSPATTRKQP